jgi:hypothetical protein
MTKQRTWRAVNTETQTEDPTTIERGPGISRPLQRRTATTTDTPTPHAPRPRVRGWAPGAKRDGDDHHPAPRVLFEYGYRTRFFLDESR